MAKNIPFTINAIHFVLYNLITYFYVYSVQLFIEKFITHKLLPCSSTSTKKQLSPYFLGITIDKICRKGYNIEEDINSFLTNYFLICAIYVQVNTTDIDLKVKLNRTTRKEGNAIFANIGKLHNVQIFT